MQSKPLSEGEQRFHAAAKNWLSFLPEIKQEIQSFLELPQNAKLPPGVYHAESTPFLELTTNQTQFSRLQDCLSRLNKLPDVQVILNETDTTKLTSIFNEFQQVKFNARVAILTLRTNIEQGTDGYKGFIHSWAVNIDPFGSVPARLLVTCKETSYRIAFAISLTQESISTSVVQMYLSRKWVDPIEKYLQQINLLQKRTQLFLDGIDYELSCSSETTRSMIEFTNPSTSPFIEMEKGFFKVAEMITNENGQQAEKDYLTNWRRYIER